MSGLGNNRTMCQLKLSEGRVGLAGRQPSDISLSTCAESATRTHDTLLSNPDPFSAGVYIEVAHY